MRTQKRCEGKHTGAAETTGEASLLPFLVLQKPGCAASRNNVTEDQNYGWWPAGRRKLSPRETPGHSCSTTGLFPTWGNEGLSQGDCVLPDSGQLHLPTGLAPSPARAVFPPLQPTGPHLPAQAPGDPQGTCAASQRHGASGQAPRDSSRVLTSLPLARAGGRQRAFSQSQEDASHMHVAWCLLWFPVLWHG